MTEEPAPEHLGGVCSRRDSRGGYTLELPAVASSPSDGRRSLLGPCNSASYGSLTHQHTGGLIMQYRRNAIFSGAVALSSFLALGAGVAAGAATPQTHRVRRPTL